MTSLASNRLKFTNLRLLGGRETVRKFLLNILPYLYVKKVQAQDAIRSFALFPFLPKHYSGRAYANQFGPFGVRS